MKRAILVLVVAGLAAIMPCIAMAAVVGQGSIDFSWTPSNVGQSYSTGWFGNAYYHSPGDTAYPWSPNGTIYTSTSPLTDGFISMSGAQSLTDGDASFAFSLEHNPAYPGYTLFGGIDFYNYASFGSFQVNEGDSVSFPDFSYAYNFLGSIDSTNDHLAFNTQVDLQYYFYPQDNTHDPIYGYFYSDYYEASNCPPGTECRTKWTYFNTPDASGNIQAAGNVTFANYNFTAPEPGSVQLVARWDFAAGAMNSIYGDAFDQDPPEPPTGVVPEPGTLSLLGLGLLGLVMRRKK